MDRLNLLDNVNYFAWNLSIYLKDLEADVFPDESREFNPIFRNIIMPRFDWKGHKANLYLDNSYMGEKIGRVKLLSGYSKERNYPYYYEIIDAKFNQELNFKDGTYIAKGENIRSVNIFGDLYKENIYSSEAAQRIPLEEWINEVNIKQTNNPFPDGFARLVSGCLEYRDRI